MSLVQFWPPLWMGQGLEDGRFCFYPHITHQWTVKTSLKHFTSIPPLTLIWDEALRCQCDTAGTDRSWSVLQALAAIYRSGWPRPPAEHLCDDKFSPVVTSTRIEAECYRDILKGRASFQAWVGHAARAKRLICCGARGGERDGREGMEAVGNAASEMGKGEEGTLLSQCHGLWVPWAWGQSGAERDVHVISR